METPAYLIIPLILASLPMATLHAAPRTFTDVKGRQMNAEILSATDTAVRVKLKNGRESIIELSKLSKGDQTHIAEWREARANDQEALAQQAERDRRAVEMPLKIVAFCKENHGKKVGNGECWTLANEAFKACGMKRPGSDMRVWGRLLDLKTEPLEPGDIVEYRSAAFSSGGKTGPAHTTVVVKGGRLGQATVAEQNWSGNKTVRETSFDAGSLVSGKIMVYRPDYSLTVE